MAAPDSLAAFAELLRARFTELEPLDRAFALGSRLFIAILPLSLIAQQLASRDISVGTMLTETFRLEGAGRAAAETLFAAQSSLGAGIGIFALVVLLFAVRGFARGLQQVYAVLWRAEIRGARAIAAQVAWALLLCGYVVLDIGLAGRRLEDGPARPIGVLASVALFAAMWALTPAVLLGGRVPYRRLAVTIVLTAVSVAVYEWVSRAYFPTIATGNAERYGLIGFAFSLFSWFFINQAVVVFAALCGAVLDERWRVPSWASPS